MYSGVLLYKVGITSKTVEQRFSKELAIGAAIDVLFTHKFDTGRPAFLLEQQILKLTKQHKYEGTPFLVNAIGDTELRTEDIYDVVLTQVENLFSK